MINDYFNALNIRGLRRDSLKAFKMLKTLDVSQAFFVSATPNPAIDIQIGTHIITVLRKTNVSGQKAFSNCLQRMLRFKPEPEGDVNQSEQQRQSFCTCINSGISQAVSTPSYSCRTCTHVILSDQRKSKIKRNMSNRTPPLTNAHYVTVN